MSESAIIIALRLLHIISGSLWVGAVFYQAVFLAPSMRRAGPSGRTILQELMRRRLHLYLASLPGLVLLSGLTMFILASMKSGGAFARSPMGVAISAGAVFAIIGGVIGGAVSGRSAAALNTLGTAVASAGSNPTADQGQEILRLQTKLESSNKIVATLLLIATALMAMARYL